MADPWSDLMISSDGITIPTYTAVFRVEFGAKIPFAVGDDTHRSLQVLNFRLIPESGSTDQVTQIFGGADGQWISVAPKTPGHSIRLVHNASQLVLPFDSDIVLSDPNHIVMLVRRGVNLYAKPI